MALLSTDNAWAISGYSALVLPFVNGKTNAEYPEIAQALSVLSSAIDDATMQKLNYEVVEKGRDRAEVARTFLLERGLVKPEDFKN